MDDALKSLMAGLKEFVESTKNFEAIVVSAGGPKDFKVIHMNDPVQRAMAMMLCAQQAALKEQRKAIDGFTEGLDRVLAVAEKLVKP